jgi:MFS transporter, SP family, sugar:H+ symporter
MRSAIAYEVQVKAGFFECFKPSHKQLYRTMLMIVLQMFQQLTGANYFFYVCSIYVNAC